MTPLIITACFVGYLLIGFGFVVWMARRDRPPQVVDSFEAAMGVFLWPIPAVGLAALGTVLAFGSAVLYLATRLPRRKP